MYRGQAIIYPSMYSLNFLLYNKDYKTSNIHRWVSYRDTWPRALMTPVVMDTVREGYPEASLSFLEEAPLELFSSVLRGRNSFSPCFSGWTATLLYTPLFLSTANIFFVFMFYITCIVNHTAPLRTRTRSPAFPSGILCVYSPHAGPAVWIQATPSYKNNLTKHSSAFSME